MMNKLLEKQCVIKASKEDVWKTVFKKENYDIWSKVFSDKSTYIGTIELDGRVDFIDGEGFGLASIITTYKPYDNIEFEYIGEYKDNQLFLFEESSKDKEKYHFIEVDKMTTLKVTLEVDSAYYQWMSETWDKALMNIKNMSENNI